MGQQQLLLAVLVMVLVAIAIAVGVMMFESNAEDLNRDAIIEDLQVYAQRAHQCYEKPKALGGLNHDFTGITIRMIAPSAVNKNGQYSIEKANKNELIIVGVGNTVSSNSNGNGNGNGNNSKNNMVQVKMHINANSKDQIEIIQ